MQRRRYQLLMLLASNLLLPLLGLFSADWDPMAILVFYLAELGALFVVAWIYAVLRSQEGRDRMISVFLVGPGLAFFAWLMYRLFFVTFFSLSTHRGLTLAQIGERVHADRLGWGFVAAVIASGLSHGWRLHSAEADAMRDVAIHVATIVLSCFLLAPLVELHLGALVAVGFVAIRTCVEYRVSSTAIEPAT